MDRMDLDLICKDIILQLKNEGRGGRFPSRNFYGETFTALTMCLYNETKYQKEIEQFLDVYIERDKKVENFHWEFNNYALLMLKKSNRKYDKYVDKKMTFKGTQCTNWTLLRCVSKAMNGEKRAYLEALKKIRKNQMETGLIKDQENVSSFQYHCFSASLLYDLYVETGVEEFKERFFQAVDFIKIFTLQNGMTNYIGRGQEQLFGYGVLIYIYEIAFLISKKEQYLLLQHKVMQYIMKCKVKLGYWPLTINMTEQDSNQLLDINDARHLGWYQYNNYYDYLPFMAYYLVRTLKIKRNYSYNYNDVGDNRRYVQCGEKYFRFRNQYYDAVIACEAGYWTNCNLFPLIVYNGEIVTPCNGGEQYDCNLYNVKGISAPFFMTKDVIQNGLRERIRQFLKRQTREYSCWDICDYCIHKEGDTIVVEGRSNVVTHIRKYTFGVESISIKEEYIFQKNFHFTSFSFLNIQLLGNVEQENNLIKIDKECKIQFKNADGVQVEEKYYCALGKLSSVVIQKKDLEVKKDDAICFEYEFTM